MSATQLDELKQFISATVAQAEARLSSRIGRVEYRVGQIEHKVAGLRGLRAEMRDGFRGVGEAIERINDCLEAGHWAT